MRKRSQKRYRMKAQAATTITPIRMAKKHHAIPTPTETNTERVIVSARPSSGGARRKKRRRGRSSFLPNFKRSF